jgi:hypothetical protein
MRRIVLPRIAAASIAADVGSVTAADVGIAVKVVVPVYVDVAATPSAAPTPTSAPRRAHRQADPERYCAGSYNCSRRIRWVVNRRIGINRRSIHVSGIVRRHVNHLRICLFHNDYLFAFDNPGLDLLLLVGFQGAGALRFLPHPLNGVHDVGLLREKRVAEIGGPLNVIRQPLDQIRQR